MKMVVTLIQTMGFLILILGTHTQMLDIPTLVSFVNDHDSYSDYGHGGGSRAVYKIYFGSVPEAKANIQSSKANITSARANIQFAKASIGDPTGECIRTADDTRPANMRVVWIMKIN